ncbi:MAG: hypothetical protein KTR27_02470 [Leptolyngbyaceae cyanobacterium MAG.088]|nr:hypothetical protein [Leptolyngbyaceae cyanobacterium MAG.088]
MKSVSNFLLRSKKESSFVVTAGLLALLSIFLLSFLGPVELACEKTAAGRNDCRLTRHVFFGLVNAQEVEINALKTARLEQKVKETIEWNKNGSRNVERRTLYGVLLVGDEQVIFNGYIYNLRPQQKIVQEIDTFLEDSSQSTLVLRERNYFLDIVTLGLLGIVVILLVNVARAPIH